jgi:hypothetical protein
VTASHVPPSPRLMGISQLETLPGAPTLRSFDDDTIGELVVLGLTGDDERLTAHVAVYVENATQAAEWITMMDFDTFLESMPTWALVNTPADPPTHEDMGRAPTVIRRGVHRRRRPIASRSGADLASAWRSRRRPASTTEAYLVAALEHVPRALAGDYVEAIRNLRRRAFDRTSRELIATVCSELSTVVDAVDHDGTANG